MKGRDFAAAAAHFAAASAASAAAAAAESNHQHADEFDTGNDDVGVVLNVLDIGGLGNVRRV